MTISTQSNLNNPFVKTFNNTTLQQQLLDADIVNLNDLIAVSHTCKTMRVGFVTYKGWQLLILKRFLLMNTLITMHPCEHSYLDYKASIYLNEHKKPNAFAMALVLTEAVVRLNFEREGDQDSINCLNRALLRQKSRQFYILDDILILAGLIPERNRRSQIGSIATRIAKIQCLNATSLAFDLVKEYPLSPKNIYSFMQEQFYRCGLDAIDTCLEMIASFASDKKDLYLVELAEACANQKDPKSIEKALEIADFIEDEKLLLNVLNMISFAQSTKDSEDSIDKALHIASLIQNHNTVMSADSEYVAACWNIALSRAKKNDPEAIKAAESIVDNLDEEYFDQYQFLSDIAIIRSQKDDADRFDHALNIARAIPDRTFLRKAIVGIAIERAKQSDVNAIENALQMVNSIHCATSFVEIAIEQARKDIPRAFSASLALLKANYNLVKYGPAYEVFSKVSVLRFEKGDNESFKEAMRILAFIGGVYVKRTDALNIIAAKCTFSHLPSPTDPMKIIDNLYRLVNLPRLNFEQCDLTVFDLKLIASNAATSDGKRRKTEE